MISICITGGVTTGKSRFTALLAEESPEVATFDCDRAVHQIMGEPEWIAALVGLFGPALLTAEGQIDRGWLRERVFGDAMQRRRLEEALHPEVRRRCRAAAEEAGAGGIDLFVAEVPLLYESGFDVPRDYEIVVASSPAMQRVRLRKFRGLDDEMADRILAAQWPIMEKVVRAPIVVWNEGSIPCLKRQALCLRRRLGLSR